MKYAREHVKRYWAFSYRRALGVAMVTFALALAIGITFSSMLQAFNIVNYPVQAIFWVVLTALTILVLIVNFVQAHISSVRYMDEEEHRHHYRHMGAWVAVLAFSALAFMVPAFYFSSYLEPLTLMFSFGGILWISYISVAAIFKHYYHEIAVGAAVLWAVFGISLFSTYNSSPYADLGAFSLFISILTLIVTFGAVGITMLSNSTKAFMEEFEASIPRGRPGRAARRRR
ncbi:MAG: hypothetical protein KGH98_00800 [Candidatus Micrarchaeota archaeon]|nr:hypothetical protein [Candidatus Micrarchaeota archaeon]